MSDMENNVGRYLIISTVTLLTYLDGVVKSVILLFVFGLVVLIFSGSGLEEMYAFWLTIIPAAETGVSGGISVNSDVVYFILVWGAVVTLLLEVVRRNVKRRLSFFKTFLAAGPVLFGISIIVFTYRVGFILSLLFLGALFVAYTILVMASGMIWYVLQGFREERKSELVTTSITKSKKEKENVEEENYIPTAKEYKELKKRLEKLEKKRKKDNR